MVDPESGETQMALATESPSTPRLYIGRTQYTVTMHDPRAPALRWNTTYRRYSAPHMDGPPGKCECHLPLAPPRRNCPTRGTLSAIHDQAHCTLAC